MENGKMIKFEITVAYEDESFEEVLERLSAKVPEAYVRVLKLHGPSGGWPSIEVIIPEVNVRKFAEWYCEDDADWWEDAIKEEADVL